MMFLLAKCNNGMNECNLGSVPTNMKLAQVQWRAILVENEKKANGIDSAPHEVGRGGNAYSWIRSVLYRF